MRICEMFRSIQGEGTTIGMVTYFVRTVGCNLRCGWCDTSFSYDGGYELSVPEIMEFAKDEKNVCVTGGEPMLQNDMIDLLDALLLSDKRIVLETNGSVDLSNVPASRDLKISMDMKCPSSGMSDRMLLSNLRYLKRTDQLKFVIADDRDLEYATSFIKENELVCNVVFSPMGGIEIRSLAETVIKSNLNVRVLPQLHKVIWGDERSV